MNKPLEQHYALVTGASSGIGRAIVEALVEAGCDVCLVGRRLGKLEEHALRLREHGVTVDIVQADLTRPEDLARLARVINEGAGKLDILVHGAGTMSWGPIDGGAMDAFDAQFHCNARGPFLLTKALLPLVRASKGQIVFLNSTAGLSGRANAAAYSASKHALKGLADSLREEVNRDGVRVLSVFLGRTDTQMQKNISLARGLPCDGGQFLHPKDVAKVLLPLFRLPSTAEVTDFVLRPLVKCLLAASSFKLWPEACGALELMA